jgi:hypothetical protein
MTFDREILGFLPLRYLCLGGTRFDSDAPSLVSPEPEPIASNSDCTSFLFTGVGIPDGISRGLLKIPPGRGDHGPVPIPGLFVIMFNVSTLKWVPSTTGFNLELEGLVVFAKELAVGAKSLEDESLEECLDEEEPEAGTLLGTPESFFDPMLPTPIEDSLVEVEKEDRVPIEETPTKLPAFEDTPVPVIELILPTLVPIMKLPLVEGAVPNEGIGDLARDEDVETAALSVSL